MRRPDPTARMPNIHPVMAMALAPFAPPPAAVEDEPCVTNYYRCYRCTHEWAERAVSPTDARCPDCLTQHVEPFDSEWDTEDDQLIADVGG